MKSDTKSPLSKLAESLQNLRKAWALPDGDSALPPSPYRDCVELPIVARATFAPGDLENGRALKVRGTGTASQSMKPIKELLDVKLIATYGAEGQPDQQVISEVEGSFIGLTLLGGSFGGRSLFPAPSSEKDPGTGADQGTDCCEECHSGRTGAALPLRAFHNPLGCGIAWPTIEAGAEAQMDYGLTKEALHYLKPAPTGYDPTPKSVTAEIQMVFYGAGLR